MMKITHLPIDLITEILSRLPAKTVVCLKIICKSWRNLINDNDFVNYHLKRSLATKTNLHYFVTTPDVHNCPVFYSADFDTLDNPVVLSYPFKDCKTLVWVLGSCRGLILLRVDDGRLLLYNPTTQTYKVLPLLHVGYYTRCVFGFGYDSVSMDWKCVRIMQFLNKETGFSQCEVMLYSLNANCWKSVLDVPCYFDPCYANWGNGALVHDMFHWVRSNIDDMFKVIVVFSLRDETFSHLPLPSFHFQLYDELFIGTLDGCLCLLANCGFQCNVWLMKEYGVAESWTRMFSFEKQQWECFKRPISFSMEKKKLFVVKSVYKLAYIDLETMEHTHVKFADWDKDVDAHVYVENLLMLDCAEFGDDIRIRKKQHGKRKNTKRKRSNN